MGKSLIFMEAMLKKKILNRISKQIASRGVLDVLRDKVSDHGEEIELCFLNQKTI